MRTLIVLLVIGSGCGCGPEDADSTNARPDASILKTDAAVAAPDASVEVHDAAMPAPDASVDERDAAVGLDAGPSTIEVCDGLDNDGDGLIDRSPDGGLLESPCPLTVGVCKSARSRCIDGVYTACAYGPDYQLVETRCDGLDNDCDGRPDISRRTPIFFGDGGQPYIEFWHSQIIQTDAGFIANTLNEMIWFDDSLTPSRHITPFEAHSSGWSRLVPRSGGWARFVNLTDAYFLHFVSTEGNVSSLISRFDSFRVNPQYAVVANDGGWTALAASGFSGGSDLRAISFLPDAGTSSTLVQSGIWASPQVNGSGFIVSQLGQNCLLLRCDANASCTTLVRRADLPECVVNQTNPLMFYTHDAFYLADGGVFASLAQFDQVVEWQSLDVKPVLIQRPQNDGGYSVIALTPGNELEVDSVSSAWCTCSTSPQRVCTPADSKGAA